ncbi:hypothetical protein FRB97_005844 [Tulasnella sp. 331]|nr:hypothetical protein FRB97_005844 [Tulasnella sp. 331]
MASSIAQVKLLLYPTPEHAPKPDHVIILEQWFALPTLQGPRGTYELPIPSIPSSACKRCFSDLITAITSPITLFPLDGERLGSGIQIRNELGPNSFTYIISSSLTSNDGEISRLCAGASGRHILPGDTSMGTLKEIPPWRPSEVTVDLGDI